MKIRTRQKVLLFRTSRTSTWTRHVLYVCMHSLLFVVFLLFVILLLFVVFLLFVILFFFVILLLFIILFAYFENGFSLVSHAPASLIFLEKFISLAVCRRA